MDFTVVIAIVGNVIDEKYLAYTVFAAILIAFLMSFFIKKIDSIKEDAARIQEELTVMYCEYHKIKLRLGIFY